MLPARRRRGLVWSEIAVISGRWAGSAAVVLTVVLAAGPARAAPKTRFERTPACPSKADLDRALQTRAPTAPGTLWVRPDGKDRVAVRYAPRKGGPSYERSIATDDCQMVPEAIALLVESWSRTHLREPQKVVRKTPRPKVRERWSDRPAPTPPPVVEADKVSETLSPPPAEVSETSSPPSPAVSETLSEPEVSETLSAETLSPPVGTISAAPSEGSETLLAPALPGALFAFGGGGLLTDGTAAPSFGARAEFGLSPRTAFALQYRWESWRTGTVEPGAVSARTQGIDLIAEFALHAPKQSGLRLMAGLGVQIISAQAAGYSENFRATLWAPEAMAAVEWHQPLVAGLFARASLGAEARMRTERLEVEPYGTVLTLPAVGGRAGVGVGWSFP